jgi:hypothetical protein
VPAAGCELTAPADGDGDAPGFEEAPGCDVVSRDPGEDEDAGPLDGEFDPDPSGGVATGGVWTGTGRDGVLTGGVAMLGVVTCGVVTCAVVTGPIVTLGAVTVGVVTGGTVTDGTDTGEIGEDAAAGAAETTSAATLARTVSTARAQVSRAATTRDQLPHGLSTDDGADIAHRPRSRPQCSTGITGRFSLHPRRPLDRGPLSRGAPSPRQRRSVRLARSPKAAY